MNLLINGSFESGQLPPWTVEFNDDPDTILISDNHALLPVGTQISQTIDPAEVGQLEHLVFKVNARASMVTRTEMLKVKCRFRFGVRCHYEDGPHGNILDFEASGGMQTFSGEVSLFPAKPLLSMQLTCWVLPFAGGPEHDLRDILFTGFELVPRV